jgi:hypothetical protein
LDPQTLERLSQLIKPGTEQALSGGKLLCQQFTQAIVIAIESLVDASQFISNCLAGNELHDTLGQHVFAAVARQVANTERFQDIRLEEWTPTNVSRCLWPPETWSQQPQAFPSE